MRMLDTIREDRHARPLPIGWQSVRLGEVCRQDRQIVEPFSREASSLTYYSLEHIEAETGHILRTPLEKVEDEGKSTTFRFDERHVLYGKLRPYLNKVALPDVRGRCTTEIIPLLPADHLDREFLAWLLRRRETVDFAMQDKTGSRMPRADMTSLLRLRVALPPLDEQRRIAGALREQMAAVEKAREAAQSRLDAATSLACAWYREAFTRLYEAKTCECPLGKIVDFLTAKSLASDGDADVRAITTACLSEVGFLPEGIKNGRMRSGDVGQCTVRAGEVLIARSNTPDLVGRVSIYDGTPTPLVATDLTIRMWSSNAVAPEYLATFLSYLYQKGYWREVAGGASGSMKKITRAQLQRLPVPLPSIQEQRAIAEGLIEKVKMTRDVQGLIADEASAVASLPSAMIRRTFQGVL